MKTVFYFARHAQAQSNVQPGFQGKEDSLTEEGRIQAKKLALHFKDAEIEALYSSTILRAISTAEEIGKIVSANPEKLDLIRERKGSFRSFSVYDPIEPFEDFKARLRKAKEFFESAPEGSCIAVTHAVFLKSFAAYLMFGESVTEDIFKAFSGSLRLDNAGVSKIVYDKKESHWHIKCWNLQY